MNIIKNPRTEIEVPLLYEIKHSEEIGRYLIASQDIEPRTVIICEKPLVSGPADDETDSEVGKIPMCLGCYRRMTTNSSNRCRKCAWPVCGFECEIAELHAENECQVFVKNGVTYPCRHTWPIVNKSVLVLRTLLLKNKYPSLWREVILKLEHHTQLRQTKPCCTKADNMILDNLRGFVHKCGVDASDEDVIRISGVINVNAFSSIKSDFYGTSVRLVQCIYPQSSLLAHSCIPNASWSIEDCNQFRISIFSAVKIRKGEMICISYNISEMVSGTLHRTIAIEDVAHFVCKCIRCSDPTEAGTYVSAIKCFHCEENYLLPKEPTDPDSKWHCSGCNSFQDVQRIVLFLNRIEESYENIKKLYLSREMEVKKLEFFVRQNEGKLHKNHYILQEIRMRIIHLQLLALEDLNETDLETVIKHCKIMLSIADKLMPGFSRTRALLQFYLSQGLLVQAAAINEDENGKLEDVKNVYKDIHYLLTRSLLYFNTQSSSKTGPTAVVNQFITCIQRQLKSFEMNIVDH